MAQKYPTTRTLTGYRPQAGPGNLMDRVIQSTEYGAPPRSQEGSLPYGKMVVFGDRYNPWAQRRDRSMNAIIAQTNANGIWDRPRRQQVIGYARALSQRAPEVPLARVLQIALGLYEYVSGDTPGSPARVPGAGYRLVAKCLTGGTGDRYWNTSTIPATPSSKNIVNNCTVSTAFFPGSTPDQSTRSFGVVESQPTPGFPNRAKALQFWERNLIDVGKPQSMDKPWIVDDPIMQAVVDIANKIKAPVWRIPAETPVPKPRMENKEKPAIYDRTYYWAQGTAQLATDGQRIRIEPSSHRWAPPPSGVKESKLRSNTRALWGVVMNAFTETGDFVEALHDALPGWARRSRTWKGKDGKWHRRRIDSMLRDLYNSFDELDWNKVAFNLVANQAEDAIIGRTSQFMDKRTAQNFGTTGIQGASSRLTGASGGSAESRNPFAGLSEIKEGLADYLGVAKSKGRFNPSRSLANERK